MGRSEKGPDEFRSPPGKRGRLGICLLVVASLASFAGCADSGQGPEATRDPSAVHRALLLQIDLGVADLALVRRSTRAGRGPVRPMSAERMEHLRSAGMDVDNGLAEKLAEAIGGASTFVEIPPGVEHIRLWDGASPEVGPSGFLYSVDGRTAVIVELFPVVFSVDGDRALTFLDTYCGPLECAAGSVALLRRDGVEWVLESHVWTWES